MANEDAPAPRLPTDVVSVDRMRRELRLPAPLSDDAARILTGHIASAVDWVAHAVERPLLGETQTLAAPRPADPLDPIALAVPPGPTAVESIRAHAPEDDLAGPPGIALAPAELGRLEDLRDPTGDAWGTVRQWPPAGGWPAVAPGTTFVVVVRPAAAALPPAVAQAVVLIARDLWHGTDVQGVAARRLLQPFARRAIG